MVSKDFITKSIDDAIIKCTTILKSSPYYATAMEMCDKYGLTLKRCNNTELRFIDEGHKNPLNDTITETEIRFDEFLDKTDLIDFTNSTPVENGSFSTHDKYNLDEILNFYDSMPINLKNGVGMIVFSDDFPNNCSQIYDKKYHRQNVITLNQKAFQSNYETGYYFNLEMIMAHEMGHCLGFEKLSSSEIDIIKKLDKNNPNSVREFKEKVEPKMYHYCRDGTDFAKAVEEAWLPDMDMPSWYARKHFEKNVDNPNNRYGEHFAETIAMASFKNKPYKNHAKVLYNGEATDCGTATYEIYDYDRVKEFQGTSFKVAEDLLGV